MPIGKNAIKRVTNNGYSKVESSAPDMENSSVIANIDQQVVDKIIAPVEKKTATKKAPAKKTPAKKVAPAKETPAEKAAEVAKPKRKYTKKAAVEETPAQPKAKRKYTKKSVPAKKEGFERVEVGAQMPYYLL